MKLTKEIKSFVAHKAVSIAFDEKMDAAMKLVELYVKEEMSKTHLRIADVPEGWKEYIGSFQRCRLWCNGADIYVDVDGLFAKRARDTYLHQIGTCDSPCDDIPVVKNYKMLDNQRDEYGRMVKQVLNSVNTLNQLAAISPALTALVPNAESSNAQLVPKQVIDAVEARLKEV